jgi:hypothetical protein
LQRVNMVAKSVVSLSGTEGSNPSPSTSESTANLTFGANS